jgi:RepB DNA-primase N-terminal domain
VRDRTQEIMLRQTQAMDTTFFEVGLFKPSARAEMLLRTWDSETLFQSISWLKFQNMDGRNIYIRPNGEHSLSLIDDLTSEALERMKHTGFTPALVVETSPGNFQAWLNHGKVLPKDTSTVAARTLAERFGGDLGAADWRHFGRFAGFTNRKDKYRQPNGLFPYVRLVHATGQVYEMANPFTQDVESRVAATRIRAEQRRKAILESGKSNMATAKRIEDFREDPRYAGDGNRIDLAFAVHALSHGIPEGEVRSAIAGRDLSHKGTEKRQMEYIERTIEKALRTVGKECLAR